MAKSLGILQLSVGDWHEGIDYNLLNQSDIDLLNENSPVISFYNEDSVPANYQERNTIGNWRNYAIKYANEDHLGCKLAVLDIFTNTIGSTELLKFNTFNLSEKESIVYYDILSDMTIGINFYLSEEGVDSSIATDYVMSLKFQSMEKVADSCNIRYNTKAFGWYPIIFEYYAQTEVLLIKNKVIDYLNLYVEDGILGTNWGDTILGLLDFINGTGGITDKLSDHTLLPGKVFNDVKEELTQYFYQRWT